MRRSERGVKRATPAESRFYRLWIMGESAHTALPLEHLDLGARSLAASPGPPSFSGKDVS